MNLLTLLQGDLRSLSVEAKKKYPAVKEAADRAIVKLRSLDEKTPARELARSEEVVRPVLMALDPKNVYSAKLLGAAVPCLQKLLSNNAVPADQLPTIVEHLSSLSNEGHGKSRVDSAIEDINVKILQALTTLVSCNPSLHGPTIAKALTISFKLHAHGGNSVHNTASATLPMTITMLFDRAELELGIRRASSSATLSTPKEQQSKETQIPPSPKVEPQQKEQPDAPNEAQKTEKTEEEKKKEETVAPKPPQEAPKTPEKPPKQEKLEASKDALDIMNDLCSLVSGEPATFLTLEQLAPTFGLELIELLLSSHVKLFRTIPLYRATLSDKVCPLLIKAFHRLSEFPLCVRLVRLVGVFVSRYEHDAPSECEVLLIRLCRLLVPEMHDWQQVLALEVLRPMLTDPHFVCTIYRNYDSRGKIPSIKDESNETTSPVSEDEKKKQQQEQQRVEIPMSRTSIESEIGFKVYEDTVSVIARLLQSSFSGNESPPFSISDSNPPAKSKCIEHLLQAEPPQIKPGYRLALNLSCLLAVSSTLHDILRSPPSSTASNEEPSALVRGIATSSWAALLGGLSITLSKTRDSTVQQTILKAYENTIYVLGTVGLSVPRDAFLTSLCKFSIVSPLTERELKEKSSSKQQEIDERAALAAQKAVEAVKTLMAVAHCFGNVLGKGWNIALQAVEAFNKNPAAHSTGIDQQSDMGIASFALSSLFESTLHLDTDSTLIMLTELTKLSIKALPNIENISITTATNSTATNSSSSTSSTSASSSNAIKATGNFYLDKVMETALLNATRIDRLWKPFREHAVIASKHSSQIVRNFVISSLTDLFLSTLHPNNPTNQNQQQQQSNNRKLVCGAPLASSAESISQMQVPFVELFEELLATTTFSDTRIAILESINKLVQSAGDSLTESWPHVLTLLTSAARIGDKQACAVAFQTVQLIGSDYLQKLPIVINSDSYTVDCLSQYISLASLYARQTDHVNISLSSNEILWNVASFVAKLLQPEEKNPKESETETEKKSAESDEKSKEEEKKSEENVNEQSKNVADRCRSLWNQIFSELKGISIDERFDVRSSAMSILFRALSTHAPLFDQQMWELCLWDVLFQMIDTVKLQASSVAIADIPSQAISPNKESQQSNPPQTPSKQESQSQISQQQQSLTTTTTTAPSKDTRNSPQKQWGQSVVMAIDGVCRLFKVTTELISSHNPIRFSEAWKRVCAFVRDCAADISAHEVGECSLNSLLLLLPRAAELKLPRELWDSCLTSLENVVSLVSTRNPHRTTPQVLAAACLSIQETIRIHSASTYLLPSDLTRFAACSMPLCLLAIDDFVDDTGMTALQKAAFHLLEVISTLTNCSSFDDTVIENLIILYASLAPRANSILQRRSTSTTANNTASQSVSASAQGRTEERRNATLFYVGSIASTSCANLFSSQKTTKIVKSKVFEFVARSIGEVMLSRHHPPPTTAPQSYLQGASMLWKAALNAFNQLLINGLESVKNNDDFIVSEETKSKTWATILDFASEFLFPSHEPIISSSTVAANVAASGSSAIEIEQLDVNLVDNLVNGTIKYAIGRIEVGQKLLNLLIQGGRIASRGREKLCVGCFHGIFQMASVDKSRKELVSLSATSVILRCKEVITQFLTEDRGSGNAPIPRSRLIEMQCVLRESLELKTSLPETIVSNASCECVVSNSRAHLIVLYPLLCECVTTPELEIKADLRALLELIGHEFLGVPQ